jgi:hypothetical protein
MPTVIHSGSAISLGDLANFQLLHPASEKYAAVSSSTGLSGTSEIERFARSYWVGYYDQQNLVIILSGYNAYFDATATPGADSEAIVAGYVSTVEAWANWEVEWKLILAEFDVPYFHFKDFNSCKRAYSAPKWRSNAYRARFLSKLIGATNAWAIASIGGAIRQSVFDLGNSYFHLEDRFNPYAIAGRDCGARTHEFIRDTLHSHLPIVYIFERGDEGRGLLMKEMELSGLPTPVFKRPRPDPAKDKDDPPAIQLQACDLAAWEAQRAVCDIRGGKRGGQLRKALHAVTKIKHRFWNTHDREDMLGLCMAAKIPPRDGVRIDYESVAGKTVARLYLERGGAG